MIVHDYGDGHIGAYIVLLSPSEKYSFASYQCFPGFFPYLSNLRLVSELSEVLLCWSHVASPLKFDQKVWQFNQIHQGYAWHYVFPRSPMFTIYRILPNLWWLIMFPSICSLFFLLSCHDKYWITRLKPNRYNTMFPGGEFLTWVLDL